jgi:tetratricopeptide (TPR) repeat protein
LGAFYSGSTRVCLDWGDRPAAEAATRRVAAIANDTGDAHAVLEAMHAEMLYATLDGRLVEAVDQGMRFLQRAEELGATRFGNTFVSLLTLRPHLYLGDAEAAMDDTRRLVAERGSESVITECRRALLLAALGQRAEAQALIDSFMSAHGANAGLQDTLYFPLVYLLEATVLMEDREHAAALAEVLGVTSDSPTGFHAFTCVARHLGAAYELLGELDEAYRHYQQALHACARINFRPERALTSLAIAELLLTHYPDRQTEAMNCLDFAIEELRAMRMQPSLELALHRKRFRHA